MSLIKEIVEFIKANLALEIRRDLQGNRVICLLFGDELLSMTKLDKDE